VEDRIRVAANALVIRNGKALLVVFSGGQSVNTTTFPAGAWSSAKHWKRP
jgi:hypothetical protein